MYDDEIKETGPDAELLKRIRERYAYATNAWKEIREQKQIDMRYVGGDPWSAEERKVREDKDNPRPCLSHDELNQYVNTAINNLRQNKRGIKIDPDGNGADTKTAELLQDQVRTIEYRSNAQAACVTAYQGALEGSYGYFRIGRRYVENNNITAANFHHQELVFRNIANSDSVLFDPDCKEADWSDANYCFVLNPIPRKEFKRLRPNAEIVEFTLEHTRIAKDWIGDQNILTAEYWEAETTETTVYLLDSGEVVDTLPKGVEGDKRTKKKRTITQYITNGIEILKRTPEPEACELLPIVPVLGKEMYIDDGAGSKRVLMSLVRLARDPQMSLAFLVSQEAEEAGLTPKVPYKGYVGQFETDSDTWENITKRPHAMVQADVLVDGATGGTLPLPIREQFTPHFQEYEVAKDGARRAIQAAMGVSSLPTAAQRDNQKSGVALEKIQTAQNVGSFHFLDNFDRALMLAGRILVERIPEIYGQKDREMSLRKADDKHRLVKLNTDAPYLDEETNEMVHYPVDKGTHTVTVSTGPWQESQNEAVSDFVDLLVQNLKGLPIAPQQAQQILAMAIKMKNLGVKGDELAELISPTPPPGEQQQQLPPEVQQHIAQSQQQMQLMAAELQKLQAEKQGKVVENTFRMQIEQMKIEADLAKAEILTKAQSIEERTKFLEDAWAQLHNASHEVGLQAQDHANALDAAAQGHQNAIDQQQQGADQQQAAAEQAQQAEPTPSSE